MFSKAKRDTKSEDQLPDSVEGDAMKADTKGARRQDSKSAQRQKLARPTPFGVPSLISGDMVVKGEIRSEGEVQFDGEIEGDIHAKGIVIGEGASVRGQVVAEKVKVAGTVDGQIRATRVELTATARVDGDILHTALMIEAGARFDGTCRHSEQPLGADEAPAKTDGTSEPAPANVPREREAMLREAAASVPLRRDGAKGADKAAAEPAPASGKAVAAQGNLR